MRIKTYHTVSLETENKKLLEELTAIMECSNQNECLSKILKPMYEAFSFYKTGKLESYPLASRAQIVFQLYPKQAYVTFGQNQPMPNGDD